jgi:Predicted membrane protein
MSLSKNFPPANHSSDTSRLAGIGFFCACVLSLTALACSPNNAENTSDAADTAAVPAASTPSVVDTAPSSAVPSQAADSAGVATGSVSSETAAASVSQPATQPAAPKAAAKQPSPEPKRTAAAKASSPPATPTEAKPAAPKAAATETAATKPEPAATQVAAARTDSLLVTPEEYDGWKFFHVYCYRCHGTDAMGSDIAPNLRHSVGPEGSVTHEVFIHTVMEGRLPKGMPSWKTLLDSAQIEHLYRYVKARSNGSLVPGRPHVKK